MVLSLVFALAGFAAAAADYPAPKEGDWVAHDFRFHTGEVMGELRLHYTTIGDPKGEPVLILHGTTGAGANFLMEREFKRIKNARLYPGERRDPRPWHDQPGKILEAAFCGFPAGRSAPPDVGGCAPSLGNPLGRT